MQNSSFADLDAFVSERDRLSPLNGAATIRSDTHTLTHTGFCDNAKLP